LSSKRLITRVNIPCNKDTLYWKCKEHYEQDKEVLIKP